MDSKSITNGQMINTQWIYDSPIHSEVEAKLRQHLVELGSEKILGIQVSFFNFVVALKYLLFVVFVLL